MSIPLNSAFNIDVDPQPIQGNLITRTGEVVVPNESVEKNIETDYDQTRQNLHSLLQQGQEALLYALEVAKQSEHPRAFEVVGNLVKQLADVNHQLLDLTEKRQRLVDKPQQKEQQAQTITNNAIFVGSTSELNKMLKNALSEGE